MNGQQSASRLRPSMNMRSSPWIKLAIEAECLLKNNWVGQNRRGSNLGNF